MAHVISIKIIFFVKFTHHSFSGSCHFYGGVLNILRTVLSKRAFFNKYKCVMCESMGSLFSNKIMLSSDLIISDMVYLQSHQHPLKFRNG